MKICPLGIAVPILWAFPMAPTVTTSFSLLMARGTQPQTYKSVQGCGVIQKLLSQIPRADSPHAPDPYWPEEVLFHKHGG